MTRRRRERAKRKRGRPRGPVPLARCRNRFAIAVALAFAKAGTTRHGAAKIAVALLSRRRAVIQLRARGEIVAISVDMRHRRDGRSLLQGPAGRLARHISEISERGDIHDLRWAREAERAFSEVLAGLYHRNATRFHRGLRWLAAVDSEWPTRVETMFGRMRWVATFSPLAERLPHPNLLIPILANFSRMAAAPTPGHDCPSGRRAADAAAGPAPAHGPDQLGPPKKTAGPSRGRR